MVGRALLGLRQTSGRLLWGSEHPEMREASPQNSRWSVINLQVHTILGQCLRKHSRAGTLPAPRPATVPAVSSGGPLCHPRPAMPGLLHSLKENAHESLQETCLV